MAPRSVARYTPAVGTQMPIVYWLRGADIAPEEGGRGEEAGPSRRRTRCFATRQDKGHPVAKQVCIGVSFSEQLPPGSDVPGHHCFWRSPSTVWPVKCKGREYVGAGYWPTGRFASRWAFSVKCGPRIKSTLASCKTSELVQAIWCSGQP